MLEKISESFEITENVVSGFKIIRVKKGKFAGVEYTYGAVGINFPDGEDSPPSLSYEVNVIVGEADLKDKDFVNLTGDILFSIINQQLLNGEAVYFGGT